MPAHRLEGDLGDQFRPHAGLEHRDALAHLAVLRQRAPGLPHEPHGGVRHRLTPARLEERGVVRGGRLLAHGALFGTHTGKSRMPLGQRRTTGATAREPRGGARTGRRDPDIAPARGCPSLRRGAVPLNLPRMAAAQGRLSDDAGGMDGTKGAEGIPGVRGVRPRRPSRPRWRRCGPRGCGRRSRWRRCPRRSGSPVRVRPGGGGRRRRRGPGRRTAGAAARTGRHDAWHGTFRLVTLVRAELEPEMAADPLLPDVCWTWLTGALQARGLTYGEPSGTVTRASSHYFGGSRHGRRPRRSRSGRRGHRVRGWAGSRTPRRTSRPGAICWRRSRVCRRPRPATRRS